MSVTIYPGIRRIHLLYTTRYDTIRTSDVRDDLLGIKVWYSTTVNFNPQTVTPIEFGVGSSISIDNLETNTQYYIRYAFISRIDPSVYTISNQVAIKTYDEFTRVYGELTNDPHYLARSATTGAPDWQYATGTFRVWNVSQEVTGNGPVYSVVANSASNGIQATINPTTGVFTATGWTGTATAGKITFKAVYDGIEVLRDWNIINGIGQDAPQIRLVMVPDNFLYRDAGATLAETAQVVATANLTNLTGTATFTVKAYRADGTEITSSNPLFTQNNNTITISRQQFHVSNEVKYAVVRAQIGNVYDEDTILRLDNGTDSITIDVDNPVVQLQADEDGLVDPTEYLETGTVIEVYEGGDKLAVDINSPYSSGTWRITNIDATGIVAEDQPVYTSYSIAFPQHANMTADTAEIAYTVEWRTKSGAIGSRVVKQKFSKSKQGITGASAPQVTLRSAALAFVRPANQPETATSPAYIDVVASTSNVLNPQYVWRIEGQVQTGQTTNTLRINKFTNVASKEIRVDVTGQNAQQEPITLFDEHTLYYLQEGSSVLAAAATPENTPISCDSNNVPDPSQFPLEINTTVVRGSEIIPSNQITYNIVEVVGVTFANPAVNTTTGKITVTGITTSYASFKINFTIGTETVYRIIRFNKVIDGSSAPVVNITADPGLAFVRLKNSTAYNTPNIELSAQVLNIPGAQYAWYVDNVLQSGQVGSEFIVSAFAPTASKLIKCVVSGSGGITAQDIFTVYSVQEGDDSISAGLVNENQTLQADKDGVIYSGQLPITTNFLVFRGAQQVTSNISFSKVAGTETGITSTIDAAGTITVSAFTGTSSGSCTYRATISVPGTTTVTVDKTLTITKTKDGATGQPGAPGNGVTTVYQRWATQPGIATSTTTSPPQFWYATVAEATTANPNYPLWASDATVVTAINGSKVYTWNVPYRVEGIDGTSGSRTAQAYIRSSDLPDPPGAGTANPPIGWYDTIAGTPGTGPVWTTFGTKAAGSSTWTWQQPVRVSGEAGLPLRNATGFLYYGTAQGSAPGPVSASGYNFSTGSFSSVTSGWATTFTAPSPNNGVSLWAVRYSVQETEYGGAQTVTISSPFTHQNFDGLVTFTNNQYVTSTTATSIATTAASTAVNNAAGNYATNTLSNVTAIDGGKITTNSIYANQLRLGNTSGSTYMKLFENKIEVYDTGVRRVVIGNLSSPAGQA